MMNEGFTNHGLSVARMNVPFGPTKNTERSFSMNVIDSRHGGDADAHANDATTRTALSDRVDTLGWGLLFVAIGAVSLLPAMPDGAWLIAAGLVMLGASAARAWLRLPVSGVTVVVGIVALAAGVFTVAGLTTEVGPLVLIVLGAGARRRRAVSGTAVGPMASPLAHTH